MHDPTEGGVATGIREICLASNCGVQVEGDAISMMPETVLLCRTFGLEPLGALSSGSLLLTVAPEAAAEVIAHYDRAGIQATVIGEILPLEAGLWLRQTDGSVVPLPEFAADEITRLFG
jgi:hydrogenase maturation factor